VWSITLVAALVCCPAGFAAPPDLSAAPAAKGTKVATGSLVIVGGGRLPDGIRDRFLELAGGEKARLVVIPTASQLAESGRLETLTSYAYWSGFMKAHRVASVVFLHTRRPEQANDPAFVKPLTEASAVWFGGGDQSLLTAAYKGTAVEKEIRNLLARGGVVGGTSAGAAVMSDVMIRSGKTVAEVGTGFGFVSGLVVDQHFEERNRLARLQGVLAKYPRLLGLGIDEQTGVVVQGQNITVLGKSHVLLCFPAPESKKPQVKVFAEGARIDLTEVTQTLNLPPKMD